MKKDMAPLQGIEEACIYLFLVMEAMDTVSKDYTIE